MGQRVRVVVALALSACYGKDPPHGSANPDADPPIVTPHDGGPPTSAHGLKGAYYEGRSFQKLRHTRVDNAIDFDWQRMEAAPGVPIDGFSVRWTGWLRPRYSELYTLHALSDDGIRVFIDGKQIISDWVERTPMESSGTVALTADAWYVIRIEYFELTDIAVAKLFWSSASQTREVIPAEQFSPE